MKPRNEIGLLLVLHDPLELEGKSSNKERPWSTGLYESTTSSPLFGDFGLVRVDDVLCRKENMPQIDLIGMADAVPNVP